MSNNRKFNLLLYVDRDLTIKDPIHREINFYNEKWILDFIATPEFKRLKYVMQLGVSYKVFPSATNNRYMHSIGAFQVASKFMNELFPKVSTAEKKLFLITALLHDIGHGPFSHVFEKISNTSHECITKQIILDSNSQINKLLIKNNIRPKEVVEVLDGVSKYDWINKLISSNLDIDRIDYMLRDSYFLGTHYSTIDIDFLIKRTHFIDNDIYFASSTINVIESFLLGRYYIHQDIYNNKHSYIYEWALVSIFSRLKEIKNQFTKYKEKIYYYHLYSKIVLENKFEFDLNTFLHFTDTTFISFIDSLRIINDKIINSFLDAFFKEDGVVSLDYSKRDHIDKIIKDITHKIDEKYLINELWKGEKIVYVDDEKYHINIIDTKTNKLYKFDHSKFVHFNNARKENKDKIILVNKNLII